VSFLLILPLAIVGSFLVGQWWGQRTMRQFLHAAVAVQTITNESMGVIKDFVEGDSRTASAVDAIGVKVGALVERQEILGRGVENIGREVGSLRASENMLMGGLRNGRSPGGRVVVTDDDLS